MTDYRTETSIDSFAAHTRARRDRARLMGVLARRLWQGTARVAARAMASALRDRSAIAR